MAVDGAAAPRRRRPRRRDPVAAGGVGGVGPPQELHRPAGRLPGVPRAVPPRQARRPRGVPQLRRQAQLHRGPAVQPDVQDLRRPGRGGGRRGLPAPRDRAGHVPQLQERARDVAQAAAVRHRPDRQVVPQRDHARQLRVPHPRVRADGDGVLRPARRERAVVRVLVPASGCTGTSTSACRPRSCACGPTTPTSCRTTRRARATSSSCSRGAGTSSRASPTAATTTCASTPSTRARSSSTSTRRPTSATCPTSSSPPRARRARRWPSSWRPTTRRRWREGEGQGEVRTVLRLHPRIAPYKVAVLPLSKKAELQGPASEVLAALQPHWMCDYDETQAIGRRYRRQDELGTPFCVTVDFDTLDDQRRHGARPRHDGAGARADRRPARPPAPRARRLSKAAGLGQLPTAVRSGAGVNGPNCRSNSASAQARTAHTRGATDGPTGVRSGPGCSGRNRPRRRGRS